MKPLLRLGTALALFPVLTAGCGNNSSDFDTRKICQKNYDKIKHGMTLSHVQEVLGKGRKATRTDVHWGVLYVWGNEDFLKISELQMSPFAPGAKGIAVWFRDGKVDGLYYIDNEGGRCRGAVK